MIVCIRTIRHSTDIRRIVYTVYQPIFQTVVVQLNMMGKRKGCAVEYRRHVNATAHQLVNKSLVMGCTHGIEATLSNLAIE